VACAGIVAVRWPAAGNRQDRGPHAGLTWTRDRSWDANRCWIWNWPRAVDLQWQPPTARRGVSSEVAVQLSIRNLQVVWRATVVRCIAKAAEFEDSSVAEIPDNRDVTATSTANRGQYVRRGRRLEYFTIAYNSLEGAASIIAGLLAGSVSLVGFGLDSMIEVASGAALLWRLHHDMDTLRREQAERTALRTVGACFVALALYIVYESSSTLIRQVPPERSIAGIVIASASVIVMPLLARAKPRVGRQIGSGAMHADSKQADFCGYLCGILLGGLLLNAFLGWWWMDPVAGLVMVPIIAKEGIAGLRAKACCDDCRID